MKGRGFFCMQDHDISLCPKGIRYDLLLGIGTTSSILMPILNSHTSLTLISWGKSFLLLTFCFVCEYYTVIFHRVPLKSYTFFNVFKYVEIYLMYHLSWDYPKHFLEIFFYCIYFQWPESNSQNEPCSRVSILSWISIPILQNHFCHV